MSSVVATGRRMNGSEMLTAPRSTASELRTLAAGLLRPSLPGRSWFCPSMTTLSPAASPLPMIARLTLLELDLDGARRDGLVGADHVREVPCGPRCTTDAGTTSAPFACVETHARLDELRSATAT